MRPLYVATWLYLISSGSLRVFCPSKLLAVTLLAEKSNATWSQALQRRGREKLLYGGGLGDGGDRMYRGGGLGTGGGGEMLHCHGGGYCLGGGLGAGGGR